MKNLTLLLLLLPWMSFGQLSFNHVPNSSFESYNLVCPSSPGQVNRCVGWRQYTSGTSDYFNSCDTGIWVAVPDNSVGYQFAAHGQAYMGCGEDAFYSYKEYFATSITPLVPGYKYKVSISVSLANNSTYGTNDIGIYFYDSGPSTNYNTQGNLNVTPQILYTDYGPITDTTNWVRLTQIFQADSAYDNIVIGTFLTPNAQTRDTIQPHNNLACYYYYDSVVVKLLDSFTIHAMDTILCASDTFLVNYHTPEPYNSNNTFTAQLSDKNGSFSSPINIGIKSADTSGTITCVVPATIANSLGYKVRIIASSPSDTTKNISPDFRIGNPDSTAINTTDSTTICSGGNIQLSASTGISPTTYTWTGPNSFNSTLQNPSIGSALPTHSGNYFVSLKFYGCEVTNSVSVLVKPLPVKPIAVNNSPFCAGDTLQFNSTGNTNNTYSWSGPNSYASSVQNPTIANSTVSMSGDYIVTVDSSGCTAMDTTTVTIKPSPDTVTLSNNGPLCAGSTLLLNSDTSSTGASYTWSGPNSFSANTRNTTSTNTTASLTGWYIMTVDLNGCVYIDSTYATIHPIPTRPTISHVNPLCVGETLNLVANTVSGATYTWSGPNNFSSNQQNPSRSNMQFGDTGMYRATVTVNGCTSPADSMAVQLNPKPFVVILSTPMDSICNGDPVAFTAYPNNHGGTPTYSWYINNQLITTGKPFSTTALNDGDIIRCEMAEYTKCSTAYTDSSNDIKMTVLPWLAPTVSITANPTTPLKENEYVNFTATPVNAGLKPDYQWKRNGTDILGATSNIWSANTLNDNDSVSVEVFSKYKCPSPTSAHSNGIRVKVLTDVDDLSAAGSMRLYPNPNNGKFVVTARCKTGDTIKLSIINAAGQVVYREDILPASNKLHHEIEVQQLATGIYLLRMATDSGDSVLRFVVER